VALQLLRPLVMPETNKPEELDEVRSKVVYERVSSSGTAKQNAVVIIVLVVIALALVAFIFMQMHH
jgi:uncharacterized protein HemX